MKLGREGKGAGFGDMDGICGKLSGERRLKIRGWRAEKEERGEGGECEDLGGHECRSGSQNRNTSWNGWVKCCCWSARWAWCERR
jgi:hypothetical protein